MLLEKLSKSSRKYLALVTESVRKSSWVKFKDIETIEAEHPHSMKGNQWVLYWSKYGDFFLHETPTKGMKKIRFSEIKGSGLDYLHNIVSKGGSSYFYAPTLVKSAELSPGLSYEEVQNRISNAIEVAGDAAMTQGLSPDLYAKQKDTWVWNENSKPAYMVAPADSKMLELKGVDFFLRAGFNKFEYSSSGKFFGYGSDDEPSYSYWSSKSEGGARKLFKAITDKKLDITTMTRNAFDAWLNANKIAKEYNQSYWG